MCDQWPVHFCRISYSLTKSYSTKMIQNDPRCTRMAAIVRSYQGVSLRTMYRQLEHSGPCVMIVEDNGNLKTELSKPEKEIEKGILKCKCMFTIRSYVHISHIRTNQTFCFCQWHFHYPGQSWSLYELQQCDGKSNFTLCLACSEHLWAKIFGRIRPIASLEPSSARVWGLGIQKTSGKGGNGWCWWF